MYSQYVSDILNVFETFDFIGWFLSNQSYNKIKFLVFICYNFVFIVNGVIIKICV